MPRPKRFPKKPEVYSMRRAAFHALRSYAEKGHRIRSTIDYLRKQDRVSPADAAAAGELAAGVVRRQATLDNVLAKLITRPRKNVEPLLWTLSQIGAYQFLFQPTIPDHAVTSTTVEVAKEIRQPRWTGMLNAILRSLADFFEPVNTLTDPSRTIAGENGSLWLETSEPLFKMSEKNDEWYAKAFSYPRWLVRRWHERHTDEDLENLLRAGNREAPVWLRVNVLRAEPADYLTDLHDAGIEAEAGPLNESIRLARTIALRKLPRFHSGACSIQDLTAMHAAGMLIPNDSVKPPTRVLDYCAAPGGKTCHLAERMAGAGEIIAVDVSDHRLEKVTENVQRLQLKNVKVKSLARDADSLPYGQFDAALVDVPCSNTGVLAKRPEARWRLQPSEFEELSELQMTLLQRAAQVIDPGGSLLYSTCSVEPAENQSVIEAFLQAHPEWTLEEGREYFPNAVQDGGYQAKLIRQQ